MNRRDFLKMAGLGGGTALATGIASSEVIRALGASDLPSMLGKPADVTQRDPIAHVLNRVAFGPRPGQVDAVRKMGIEAYLEQQLNPESIPDDVDQTYLGTYATLDMRGADFVTLDPPEAEVIRELDSATVLRAVYSERQLFEVMVNFWSEHFSIWHPKEQCKYLKTIDDREVIRPHALGKFRDLLGASAKSPAMLIYLDNAKSDKKHPNENYAREVMELHTITIGNYTEQDVKEVARAFTGWTITGRKTQNPGEFVFRNGIHDSGEKTVLGQTISAGGGIEDGEKVLDILASHPVTAHHISSKLCRRFIADDPPEAVVNAATQTFLDTGGDIRAVLRVIFKSADFLNAPPKFKRPFEFLISMFRAFNVEVSPLAGDGRKRDVGLVPLQLLKQMGHLPFNHVTPDGYTDYASLWMDNLLLRWNIAITVAAEPPDWLKVDLAELVKSQGIALDPQSVLTYFAGHLLGRSPSQSEQDTIWQFVTKNGNPDLTTQEGQIRTRRAIALIAASPAFQFR